MDEYYKNIPKRTLETIDDYVKHGFEPGGFVRAVLENNLALSFGAADEHNRAALFEIVQYIYSKVPNDAWGSPEIVNDWIKMIRKNNVQ